MPKLLKSGVPDGQQIRRTGRAESIKVGMPLTQVAPICSMREWLRNTLET
jgi:hypothetical protein